MSVWELRNWVRTNVGLVDPAKWLVVCTTCDQEVRNNNHQCGSPTENTPNHWTQLIESGQGPDGQLID